MFILVIFYPKNPFKKMKEKREKKSGPSCSPYYNMATIIIQQIYIKWKNSACWPFHMGRAIISSFFGHLYFFFE